MAYTVTIERPQCRVCKKRGEVRVYNRQNAEQGSYCRRCARVAMAELERHEAADKALTVGRLRIPAISEKSRRLPEITT